jgi:hypothetical protein
MTADELDPLSRIVAERECERLIIDFVRRLDLGEPGSVAELFTADGVWEWPDGNRRIEGRDALRRYFGSRPADRLSRRMMTNILVSLTSATTAGAISYLVTYRVDGYAGGMVAPRLPVNIGHYEDAFANVDGTWLLARRVTVLPFGRDTERVLPARDARWHDDVVPTITSGERPRVLPARSKRVQPQPAPRGQHLAHVVDDMAGERPADQPRGGLAGPGPAQPDEVVVRGPGPGEGCGHVGHRVEVESRLGQKRARRVEHLVQVSVHVRGGQGACPRRRLLLEARGRRGAAGQTGQPVGCRRRAAGSERVKRQRRAR